MATRARSDNTTLPFPTPEFFSILILFTLNYQIIGQPDARTSVFTIVVFSFTTLLGAGNKLFVTSPPKKCPTNKNLGGIKVDLTVLH